MAASSKKRRKPRASKAARRAAARAAAAPILAAGAVVLRTGESGDVEVLAVHRPDYDDWSLPKGHREDGEQLPTTAVREVEEETGVRVHLDAPLPTSHYPVKGRPKQVHWWRARPVGASDHSADGEVDEVRWLSVAEALGTLTFASDRDLVRAAVDLPTTTPLLVVRHAKALARSKWSRADPLRPLTKKGRKQSKEIIPLLDAFGTCTLASSSSVRCMDTLRPYARTHDIAIGPEDALTEEGHAADPGAAATSTAAVRDRTAGSGRATALCGHRPVLPTMLAQLALPDRHLHTGDVVIAHVAEDGTTVAEDFFPIAGPHA